MRKITILILLMGILPVGSTQIHACKKYPIVYHKQYDICSYFKSKDNLLEELLGIFKLTQQTPALYQKILYASKLSSESFYTPAQSITYPELYKTFKITRKNKTLKLSAHSKHYVTQTLMYRDVLNYSPALSKILGLSTTDTLLRDPLLTSMLWQAAGTICATQHAIKNGWAINLGGGFIHAQYNTGSNGHCIADIPLAILNVLSRDPDYKFLVISESGANPCIDDFIKQHPSLNKTVRQETRDSVLKEDKLLVFYIVNRGDTCISQVIRTYIKNKLPIVVLISTIPQEKIKAHAEDLGQLIGD